MLPKVILIFFVVYLVNANELVQKCFTEDFAAKYDELSQECQQDYATQASEAWLISGDVNKLEGEGAHLLCVIKKMGTLQENGDINKETVVTNISSGVTDQSKVQKIIDSCSSRRNGTSPEKSAIDHYRCVLSICLGIKFPPRPPQSKWGKKHY